MGDLQNIIKGFAGADEMDTGADNAPSSKQAISLQALGLSNVKDPLIKKPVKFIKKEEKAELTKKGSSKKLDVPLPRRQQEKLLRIAAQEKTNETLDRWNDTVKQNRRADHLIFPLAHTLADAGLDNGELLPLTKKTAGNELEQTIMSIMEESGLGPAAQQQQKEQEKKIDANGEEQTISRSELKDLWAQRRKERELQSREQARSKRIKKIKSKTYRRVHRKERLGEEEKLHDEMVASGEIDSEEEREAAHRRRALERVGARHKESKWAKMGSKVGRAAWDDDYRAGLTDMARKDEELRKRIEGKTGGGDDDSDATSSSDDEEGNSRLLRDLDALDNDGTDEDDGPHGNLMKLKFMQRAEAQRKQANDELVAQIRRDLGSGSEEEDDDAEVQVGRRSFGLAHERKRLPRDVKQTVTPNGDAISNGTKVKPSKNGLSNGYMQDVSAADSIDAPSAPGAAGAWSSGKSAVSEKKKKKTGGSAQATELDLTSNIAVASKPAAAPKASKTKAKTSSIITTGQQPVFQAEDDSSDDEIHHPLAIRDHDLISRAFAGEDVVGEFEAEKDAIMSDEDEKIVDNTMPGWGAWAGEGISKRAQKRNKGKVMTKKEGIKKKDRKDAKLERVIVNEKRIRKNEKYLASQLPHPFESRQQYERSLRLPVGPEWMTKESFQDATKPRVIVKQGIIAPMAKPTI
ncbi:U3 small nucleolar RNA-associated protein 14 [Cytospora mali]|uniref:U3 small nucleolar RNA-associated protein 14 n=1 Tax=Cytospora mali TaxID=578113 RepID=A0A194UVI7_CYTMA|nr:U3 small nucleolar RNA-associated protein 14 [Valsa mali var. pyri (nom. inval.)]